MEFVHCIIFITNELHKFFFIFHSVFSIEPLCYKSCSHGNVSGIYKTLL